MGYALKIVFNWLLVFSVLIFILMGCSNTKDENNPVKVIFDTDIGNDIDDVLALQMLINYQKSNLIDLLGVTISKSNPYAIEYVDGFCRYNQIENMSIGYIYEGPNTENGKYLKQTLDTVINNVSILNPKVTERNFLLDAWELQRKLLSQQEDSSVIMIVVGPLTNLRRLLESGSDHHSELSGIDLVAKKVRLLSVMGGEFSDSIDFTEWNIAQDIESANIVFEYWPTKIVASGWEIGNKLLYPHKSIQDDFEDSERHPLCVSYKIYDKMPYDRPTWDLTSVLYAVEPNNMFFSLSTHGKIFINAEGRSEFFELENGKHQYLKINDENIEKTLGVLVETVTGKKRNN